MTEVLHKYDDALKKTQNKTKRKNMYLQFLDCYSNNWGIEATPFPPGGELFKEYINTFGNGLPDWNPKENEDISLTSLRQVPKLWRREISQAPVCLVFPN